MVIAEATVTITRVVVETGVVFRLDTGRPYRVVLLGFTLVAVTSSPVSVQERAPYGPCV